MSTALLDLTDKLVSVSDFSQGKAGRIFSDVADNNAEYIVLKNNQPAAIVVSPNEYRKTQEKATKFDQLLELIENMRLLQMAEGRQTDKTTSFEDFVKEEGFSMERLRKISESVDIE